MGPRARRACVGAYLVAQIALVASAGRRPDAAFGFRMFGESSSVAISLWREVAAEDGEGHRTIAVAGGEWIARDRAGVPRRIDWRDRVHQPELMTFDTAVDAPSGAAATLARLQAALDDVATHTPEDAETRALVALVTVQRNGREPYVVPMRSVRR